MTARRIALLGAESTGKTQLSQDLATHFTAQGLRATAIGEVLREWCAREGRTPRPEEQLPIAQEQERRVDTAAATHDVVIADTTALMVAIYSAMLFKDGTLYRFALARLKAYDAVLLTGLDIPWVADGLQRDGPHVREPVDALVRQALADGGISYRVVYGIGPDRLRAALRGIGEAGTAGEQDDLRAWAWQCEKCSDPQCEHRLFTGLLQARRNAGD